MNLASAIFKDKTLDPRSQETPGPVRQPNRPPVSLLNFSSLLSARSDIKQSLGAGFEAPVLPESQFRADTPERTVPLEQVAVARDSSLPKTAGARVAEPGNPPEAREEPPKSVAAKADREKGSTSDDAASVSPQAAPQNSIGGHTGEQKVRPTVHEKTVNDNRRGLEDEKHISLSGSVKEAGAAALLSRSESARESEPAVRKSFPGLSSRSAQGHTVRRFPDPVQEFIVPSNLMKDTPRGIAGSVRTAKGKHSVQTADGVLGTVKDKDVSIKKESLASKAKVEVPLSPSTADPGKEVRVETNRRTLDPARWSVYSARSAHHRESSGGTKGEGRESNQDQRGEGSIRGQWLRPAVQDASHKEIEGAVRSGLNDLVKKANVQIGQNGETRAQIRMNPDHLGFMSVDMKVDQNRVVLKILVDREDVLEQLKKDLEILKGEFGKSGLHIDSVSLKLRAPLDTSDGKGFEFSRGDTGDFARDSNSGHGSRDGRNDPHPSFITGTDISAAEKAGLSSTRAERNAGIRGEAQRTHFDRREDAPAGDYDRLLVMNLRSKDPVSFSA